MSYASTTTKSLQSCLTLCMKMQAMNEHLSSARFGRRPIIDAFTDTTSAKLHISWDTYFIDGKDVTPR